MVAKLSPDGVSAISSSVAPRQSTDALGAVRTPTRTLSSSRSVSRPAGVTDAVSYASAESGEKRSTGGLSFTGCTSRAVSLPSTATSS